MEILFDKMNAIQIPVTERITEADHRYCEAHQQAYTQDKNDIIGSRTKKATYISAGENSKLRNKNVRRIEMNTETLQVQLHQKMCAEQDTFRKWLLVQPPESIIEHAHEYIIREDILVSMEYNELTAEQATALMMSPFPLADVFHTWNKTETGYMGDIWETIESRANEVIEAIGETAENSV